VKYIVVVLDEKEVIFIFPKDVDDDHMYEALTAIRFGGERNWNRKFRGKEGEAVFSTAEVMNRHYLIQPPPHKWFLRRI
jgi:hypothetical protein